MSSLSSTDYSSDDSFHSNETDQNIQSVTTRSPKLLSTFQTRRNKIIDTMYNLSKEVLIMLVIATTYAVITHDGPTKFTTTPAAFPFFAKRPDPKIADWYRGEISKAIENARISDVSFIMFYAPWDADSLHARAEFEKTADIMHRFVTFASVNCWQPGSECRKQYSKVYKWPVLIAYPTHGRGLQYNGPIQAIFMVKFLQNVINPFRRSQTINQVLRGHNTAVIGNLDLARGSKDFGVFYSVAMRFLERDPMRDVNFALLPKKTNKSQLLIYNWNGTISYGNSTWNVNSIVDWIAKNVEQTAEWASLSGTKSYHLSHFLQPGPAIILFTPKNPLGKWNDFYDLFRQVAYEYGSCNDNSMTSLRLALLRFERQTSRIQFLIQSKECTNLINSQTTNQTISCACYDQTDHRSPLQLQKQQLQIDCETFALSEQYNSAIFESNTIETNITNLACKLNRTLQFVAIDSIRNYQFAQKLGVNLKQADTKIVIVDDRYETHHILHDTPPNGVLLRQFIQNYTKGELERSLASIVTIQGVKQWRQKPNTITIQDLTSMDFFNVIKQRNRAALVFYYSKQCAFCSGVSYSFLTVARILANESSIIFTRIDGDRNLLPWEYTMESYPAILFFPTNRKSESRVFPQNIPITSANLINFILANLDMKMSLKVKWRICQNSHFKAEKEKCMRAVRLETLQIIGKVLKEWRTVEVRQRRKVLYKLQLLRQLHLNFAHQPDQFEQIDANFNNLNINNIEPNLFKNQFDFKTEL